MHYSIQLKFLTLLTVILIPLSVYCLSEGEGYTLKVCKELYKYKDKFGEQEQTESPFYEIYIKFITYKPMFEKVLEDLGLEDLGLEAQLPDSTSEKEIKEYAMKIKGRYKINNSESKLIAKLLTKEARLSLLKRGALWCENIARSKQTGICFSCVNFFDFNSEWTELDAGGLKEFMTKEAQLVKYELIPRIVMHFFLILITFASNEVVVYLTPINDPTTCISIDEYLKNIKEQPQAPNLLYEISYIGDRFAYELLNPST